MSYSTSNKTLFGEDLGVSETSINAVITTAITDGTSNPLYQSISTIAGSSLTYKGSWIVNTAPVLADGVGNVGDVWIASTSGLFGIKPISPGDWLIYNGTIWNHFDHPEVEPPIPTNNPGFYYAGSKIFKQIDYSEIASKPVLGTASASNIGGLVDQILPLVSDVASGNQVLTTIGVGGNWYSNPTDTNTAFNKNFGTTTGTVLDGGIHTTAINDLTTTINGKAPTVHTHPVSDITGLETALTNYSQAGHGHVVTDIDGLSGTLTAITGTLEAKASISHQHTTADITDFTTAIDLRLASVAPLVHTHEIGDINGLQISLNELLSNDNGHDVQIANITDVLVVSKADVVHSHEITDVNGLQVEIQNINDGLTGKINMTDLPLNLVDVSNNQILKAVVDRGTTTWVNEHFTTLIGASAITSVVVDDIAGSISLTASGTPAINIGDGLVQLTGNVFVNNSILPAFEPLFNTLTENDLLVYRASDNKYINKQFIRDDLTDSLITTYSGNKINSLVSGITSGMVFAGVWDASTNLPPLSDSDNTPVGNYYIVSVAGNGNGALLGTPDILEFQPGDWVLKTSLLPNHKWEKIDNSNSVVSVNTHVGVVTLNTSDIPEAIVPVNKYYTEGRFDNSLTLKTTTNLTEGLNLYYTDSRFDTRLGSKTTDNLTEGTNKYYTDARFDTRLSSKTTDNLTEGTNKYYTDARFDTRLALKTTDNVAEGAVNKYFTGQIGSSISAGDTSIVITDAGTGSINTRVDNNIVSTYTTGLCSFTAPLTSTAQLKATANLPSTNTTTGSLVVTGGCGISGDIRSGGSFHGNNVTALSNVNCNGLNCDAINIASATYPSQFAGVMNMNNQLRCNLTTQSTSNSTGALVVTVGGIGIAGNVNCGGSINSTGSVVIGTNSKLYLPVNTDNSVSGSPGALRWNNTDQTVDLYRNVSNKWQDINVLSEVAGKGRIQNYNKDMWLNFDSSGPTGVITQVVNNIPIQMSTATLTTIYNNLNSVGGVDVGGNLTVYGSETVYGNLNTTNVYSTGYLSANNVDIGGFLTVFGNLTVQGTQTVLNVETVTIEDPILTLASNNVANVSDIGFYGLSNNGTGPVASGLIRKASDKVWYLTEDHISVPLAGVNYSTHLGDLVNASTQSNTYYYGDLTHRTTKNAFTIDTYTNNSLASTLHNNQIYQYQKPIAQPGIFLRWENLGVTYSYTGLLANTEYPLTLKTPVSPIVLTGFTGQTYGVINQLETIDVVESGKGTFTAFKNNSDSYVGNSYLVNVDFSIHYNKGEAPIYVQIKHGINQASLAIASINKHVVNNEQFSGSISTVITLNNFNEYIYPSFTTGTHNTPTITVNTFRMTITKL
jgi:hypothetical protein